MLNLRFGLSAAGVEALPKNEKWNLGLPSDKPACMYYTAKSVLLCAGAACVCHDWRRTRGRRQTGGDDVTRIDCDQACFVLAQVCHQMTDDDRQSAVSSCWMPLTSPRSSGHLVHPSVPPIHLLSKRIHVFRANLEEDGSFFHFSFFPRATSLMQKHTNAESVFLCHQFHSWICSSS